MTFWEQYEITDASGDQLLAEADGIENARFAAHTLHDEGEPLPIHIFSPEADRNVESLVEGRFGAMIAGSSLSRSLV